MSILAIETVGTQEIQGGLFDNFVSRQVGVNPRVEGRRIGVELAALDNHDLTDLVSYETLRNGACYAQLDAQAGDDWALALLATDQTPPHDGDTLGIANAIRRWFALARPGVRVVEPLIVTEAPHRAEEPLAREIERQLRAAISEVEPGEVVVLPVGATPAMRVLVEHLAGRLLPASAAQRWMPDASGGVVAGGLLRTLEADAVLQQGLERLRAARDGGRYRAATEHAEALCELGLIDREVATWCQAGHRITARYRGWTAGVPASDQAANRLGKIELSGDRWIGLLARIAGQMRRAEHDSRAGDALIAFVTAAEALPVVFLLDRGLIGDGSDAKRLPPPRSDCRPQQRPGHQGVADCARNALLCNRIRCDTCPLREDDQLAEPLSAAPGAEVATALRDGEARGLVRLRNELIHPRVACGDFEERLGQRIRAKADELRDLGIDVQTETLDGLLTAALEGSLVRPLTDPLDILDERIEHLLPR